MATVIERHGHSVDGDGVIHYDDRPSSYEAAEIIIGKKLDRRKSYAIIDGDVCDCGSWTQECSGCDGGGCEECGYSGKRRHSIWSPLVN